mgnify:CR=1 FL=1
MLSTAKSRPLSGNDFIAYLKHKQFSQRSLETSQRIINNYLQWVTKENLEPEAVTYQDLLEFMKHGRKTGKSPRTIQHYLNTVRHYYDHLIKAQAITTNPVHGIEVKGIKQKTLYPILTAHELHTLYHHYPNDTYRDKRNKILLGLLVYQGLRTEELARMTTKEINLREGKLDILGSKKHNGRSLQLESHQVLDLYDYLLQVRPALLQMPPKRHYQTRIATEQLFIAEGGHCHSLHNLMTQVKRKVRAINPSVTCAQQIRASVITKWVKKYPLRKAQYLAGHRYISSTENYLRNDIEGLQEELNRYHPLN